MRIARKRAHIEMSQATDSAVATPPEVYRGFSVVHGGPMMRLMRRLGIERPRKRVLAFILLTRCKASESSATSRRSIDPVVGARARRRGLSVSRPGTARRLRLPLARARRRAELEYGALAMRYVRFFHEKWAVDRNAGRRRSACGSFR